MIFEASFEFETKNFPRTVTSQVLGVSPAIRFKVVLPTSASNSSLLMLAFKFSRVNLESVLLVRSCIWRIKPIKVPTKKFFSTESKKFIILIPKKKMALGQKSCKNYKNHNFFEKKKVSFCTCLKELIFLFKGKCLILMRFLTLKLKEKNLNTLPKKFDTQLPLTI